MCQKAVTLRRPVKLRQQGPCPHGVVANMQVCLTCASGAIPDEGVKALWPNWQRHQSDTLENPGSNPGSAIIVKARSRGE